MSRGIHLLRALGVLVAVGAAALPGGQQRAAAEDSYPLTTAVPRRATASRFVDRAAAEETLAMSVHLELQHRDALQALLAAQQQPGSAQYRQWLTPEEFVTQYAPPADAYAELVRWLSDAGFAVHPWDNRLRIDFSGTVGRVERTFNVRMNHYRSRGRPHLANADPPQLPVRFAPLIRHVRLDTFPIAHPLMRVFGSGGTRNIMSPQDIAVAYNLQPLLDRGITGSGQTIAVVARSDFNASDISAFQHQLGVTVRAPIKVFTGGNPGIGAPNGVCKGLTGGDLQDCLSGEEGEVVLDVELASAGAPGAAVLVDIAGSDIDSSLLDIVTNHADAKVISMSFGACERLDTADLELFGNMYTQAAAQGQTVLVATGDDGADDCADGKGASVNVLAVDPSVTAVGGTALDPGFDTNGNASGYVSEAVWNDDKGASGGGPSSLVLKPDYQTVLGVPVDGARDIPDVSLLASPGSPGFAIILNGHLASVGGTSATTPTWAGIVAIINQASQSDGSGPINALLYRLAQRQYGGSGAAVFHDVVSGDNGSGGTIGFSATPGYDLATGLGSPDVERLVGALTAAACSGDCNEDGTVTVDEIITGVQIALGDSAVGQCIAFDANDDGLVTVDELIAAVNHALSGC